MPNNDLISREAMIKKIKQIRAKAKTLTGVDMVMLLEDAPAVDAAPVVHGRWKGYTQSRFYGMKDDEPVFRVGVFYVCSICRVKSAVRRNFCANCGARMDGGENDA